MQLTTTEKKVYEWIKNTLRFPVYGDVFCGAAILMKEKTSGYINFVSHAGRDIMNGLALSYRGEKRIQTQYNEIVEKKIKPKWMPTEIPLSEEEMPDNVKYSIGQDAHDAVKNLLEEHNKGTERSGYADEVFFQTFLKMDINAPGSAQFLNRWKLAKKWFHKMTHISRDRKSKDATKELKEHYDSLLMFLNQAQTRYYDQIQITNLNEILEETNQTAG